MSYKEDEYKGRENDIDIPIPGANDMFSAIARLVRVGTSVYAIGSGFRVYKRINHQIWQEYSQSIPIPEGLAERKVEALST
ncbi:hypothetical protein, partial [Bacillus cereus group sp. BC233]|uniref:hypothetical protein n=1 Tax=Bacillus cereus group sp. BC233 TaxID=3445337 RepID=UPI003F21D399